MTTNKNATIELNGETYELRPLGLHDFYKARDAVLRHLRNVRLRTIIDLRGVLSPDEWQSEWDQAKAWADRLITTDTDTIKTWLDTLDGVAFCLDLQLQPKYAGKFTLDQLKAMLCERAELALEVKAARDATLPEETSE